MGCGASNSVSISPEIRQGQVGGITGSSWSDSSEKVISGTNRSLATSTEKSDLRSTGDEGSVAHPYLEETDRASLSGRTEDKSDVVCDATLGEPATQNTNHTRLQPQSGGCAQPNQSGGCAQDEWQPTQSGGCAQVLSVSLNLEAQTHAPMAAMENRRESLGGVPLDSALHNPSLASLRGLGMRLSPSLANLEPLDRETPRLNIPSEGTDDDENHPKPWDPSLVANTSDESSRAPAIASDQCQHRTAVLAGDVDEQATSKCSPLKGLPASGAGMHHDQLITPSSAALQALLEQTACYSLSQSFKIQSLQFKLGFIGTITVNPE